MALKKIQPLDRLQELAQQARKDGRRIVLCHGTFDLLHIGHIRHFERARENGDLLFVTLTADRFVMKGPGRPVFTETLRAEMIAALDLVDWVGIVDEPSAISAIRAIQPAVYVKGSDYKNSGDDVTGKIVHEKAALQEGGGVIVFTDDIVFSSSSLLNRHFGLMDDELQQQLASYRNKGGITHFGKLFSKVRDLKILLIGEAIIDQYDYVDILGKSAKESIIATQFVESEYFAGGVIAAANHVASLCNEVRVLTCLGARDDYNHVVTGHLRDNVTLHNIPLPNAPTVRKQRFIDRSYLRKMYEVYYMDDAPLASEQETALLDGLVEHMAWADVVIVTDFGHGMLSPRAVEVITSKAKFLAVNTQTNSANRGFNLVSKYPRADYVCIDEPELRQATHEKHIAIPALMRGHFGSLIDCPDVVITQGRRGCSAFRNGKEVARLPAFTNKIVDTVGAGDAFFAITSPFAAIGADLDDISLIGNAAGALKVNIVGHRKSVDLIDLMKFLETVLK